MKHGTVNCKCGKEFYFETNNESVECVYCGLIHSTLGFDEKVEIVEELIDEEKFEFVEEVEA